MIFVRKKKHFYTYHLSFQKNIRYIIWLVVEPPLWKIWNTIGMISNPIYGKIQNVPNHEPVLQDISFLY